MQIKNRTKRKFNIPQQLIPLGILLIIGITSLVVVRHLLVPPTFGEFGHYRGASIEENMSLPLAYAEYASCAECHDDMTDLKAQSNHRDVSCEVCHGPAAQHIEDPSEFQPLIPRKRDHCSLCHGFDPARPSGFPQIILAMHNPGQACISCHNPHDPALSHTTEECSACHRDIANQKAVSHHLTLNCTTCHAVSDEHFVNPRLARAQKPTERALCGQCHAEDAEGSRGIPRIDMTEHGKSYLCWECHYPHYPEAR